MIKTKTKGETRMAFKRRDNFKKNREGGAGRGGFGNNRGNFRRDDRGPPKERMGGSRSSSNISKLEELRLRMIKQTKFAVKSSYENKDVLVVQSINSVDELATITNTMTMRLMEWYSIYFPETARILSDQESYVKAVLAVDDKKNMDKAGLTLALGEKDAEKVLNAANATMGADLGGEDLSSIKEYAKSIQNLITEEKRVEKYLEGLMREVAPNITAVAGAKLGAKLISHAGSLEKLALLPSSTVQIMGAEKALFKHIKEGKLPPKHGLIFQHNLIAGAKLNQRGKLARLVSAKISIAAREDYFSGGKKDSTVSLLADLQKRVDEIRKGSEAHHKKTETL